MKILKSKWFGAVVLCLTLLVAVALADQRVRGTLTVVGVLDLVQNAYMKIREANGLDYVAIKAPASIAATYDLDLLDPLTKATGTGITLNNQSALGRRIYKITVASTNFIDAAVTDDVTIATLPAKTVVYRMIADVTTPFACTGTCTSSTLSMTCGKTAGGNEYVLSFDLDAAAAVFGDAIAEMGASLTSATTPVSSGVGDIPSWASTTTLQCRLTSGTGNIGTGSATNLSGGSVTFYVDAGRLP